VFRVRLTGIPALSLACSRGTLVLSIPGMNCLECQAALAKFSANRIFPPSGNESDGMNVNSLTFD
jgi:hypothetical protein